MSAEKKLFKVSGSVTVFMLASNAEEAADLAYDFLCEEIRNGGGWEDITTPVAVVAETPIPRSWLGSVPYRSDDDWTVREILGKRGA